MRSEIHLDLGGTRVSRLDDLQAQAHQTSTDLDTSLAALGQLISDNETVAQEAAALGSEGSAQILAGPAKEALEAAQQHGQALQDKLKEYTDFVEQAKGGAG